MQIEAIAKITSARLAVVDVEARLRTAAIALSRPNIRLLVACHAGGKVAGVISKSDIVGYFARAGSPECSVADLMSPNVVSCRPEDDLYGAWRKMTARNLQNIPVLAPSGEALGVLDARDALKALLEQEEYEEQLLLKYVAGVGYQ